MPIQAELIKQLEQTIDGSIEKINSRIDSHQRKAFDEISLLIKDLEIKNGRIEQSVKNLRTIGKIKTKLEKIISSKEWKEDVKEYLKSFAQVERIQNQYFRALEAEFSPTPLLSEIRSQSVGAALNSLTANGINSAVTSKVQDILRQNITTGSTYAEITKQLREFMLTNESGVGALQRYVKQITTDALNQFSAQYTDAVTTDLGLEWYQYQGALIEDSRALCKALVEKRYVHVSELPKIVKGDFKEFEEMDGEINPKTGLPQGMIAGTNSSNFIVYRGGYNCGHKLIPVSAASVPKNLRDKF